MGIFKRSFLELIGIIIVLVILLLILNFFMDDYEEDSRIITAEINDQELFLEIADNRFLREIGLSQREFLNENSGMLFIYDYEIQELTFWMKDTLIPLDIFFLNKDFEIVYIIKNMEVCKQDPCPQYTSEKKAKYAIEVNAGWIEKNNIKVGDTVNFTALDQSES